jgi:hypothetical protein
MCLAYLKLQCDFSRSVEPLFEAHNDHALKLSECLGDMAELMLFARDQDIGPFSKRPLFE